MKEIRFNISNARSWRAAVLCMRPTLIDLRARYAAMLFENENAEAFSQIRAIWDFSELPQGGLRLSVFVMIIAQMLRIKQILGIRSCVILPESRKLRELMFFSDFASVLRNNDCLDDTIPLDFGEFSFQRSEQRFRITHFRRPVDLPDANKVPLEERLRIKNDTLRIAWSIVDEHVPRAFRAGRNPATGKQDYGRLRSSVIFAVSELTSNSWLWGRSDCIMGMQTIYHAQERLWSSTLAMSDFGIGFRRALKESAEHAANFRSAPANTRGGQDHLWFLAALYSNRDSEGLTRVVDLTRSYVARFWCAYGQQVTKIDQPAADALASISRPEMLAEIVALLSGGESAPKNPDVFSVYRGITVDPLHIRIGGVHAEFEVKHEFDW